MRPRGVRSGQQADEFAKVCRQADCRPPASHGAIWHRALRTAGKVISWGQAVPSGRDASITNPWSTGNCLGRLGSRARPVVTNEVLYQLSYAGIAAILGEIRRSPGRDRVRCLSISLSIFENELTVNRRQK